MRYVFIIIVELIILTFGSSQSISSLQTSNQFLGTIETETQKMLELTGAKQITINKFFRGDSFGTKRIIPIFDRAKWDFYTNGKFTFTPQVSTPISGSYSRVNNNIEFHGENTSELGDTLSIDGTIIFNEENMLLDAIYATNSDPQQIVRLSQQLVKDSLTRELHQISEKDEKEKKIETEEQKENEIDGITLPCEFSISIEGKTDKGDFGPINGMIIVTKPAPNSKNPLSIFLAAEPNLQGTNGWIVLSSKKAAKEAKNIQIQAQAGQVRLQVSPGENRSSSWYTLGKMSEALIENGTLTFSVEEDRILGEIRASGMQQPASPDEYFSDFKQPSFYEAKIVGKIRKSQSVEKLKEHLKFSFNGQWEVSDEVSKGLFNKINLQQSGQQVRGSYTRQGKKGEGTIQGIAHGNRLDFTWQDDRQAKKERGFFRAVNSGGTLVGLIWEKEDKEGRSLIASWQIPSFLAVETFTPFDLRKLRSLGIDLALQKRCEQSVLLLDEVMGAYLPQQRVPAQPFDLVSVEKEREPESNFINTLFPLIYLIDCYFQLGNYGKLLDSLNNGMKILRFLGPEESAGRLFRRHTMRIAEHLSHNVNVSEFPENNYRNWQDVISGNIGVVGIFLEQDETTNEVLVYKVERGQPADLAGILPRDRIVKIDDLTTHGLGSG